MSRYHKDHYYLPHHLLKGHILKLLPQWFPKIIHGLCSTMHVCMHVRCSVAFYTNIWPLVLLCMSYRSYTLSSFSTHDRGSSGFSPFETETSQTDILGVTVSWEDILTYIYVCDALINAVLGRPVNREKRNLTEEHLPMIKQTQIWYLMLTLFQHFLHKYVSVKAWTTTCTGAPEVKDWTNEDTIWTRVP